MPHSRILLFIHSVFNSWHLLTPISHSILSQSPPPWQPQIYSPCPWVRSRILDASPHTNPMMCSHGSHFPNGATLLLVVHGEELRHPWSLVFFSATQSISKSHWLYIYYIYTKSDHCTSFHCHSSLTSNWSCLFLACLFLLISYNLPPHNRLIVLKFK